MQNLFCICLFKNVRSCVLYTSRVSLFTQTISKGKFLRPRSSFSILKKNFTQYFFRKKVDYYKLDRIPENYKIVYQAPMRYYIVSTQLVTLGLALVMVVSLCTSLFWIVYKKNNIIYPIFADTPLELAVGIAAYPILLIVLQLVIRRFAMRIYYNEVNNKFIMMVPGVLPRQERQVLFRAGEMKYLGEEKYSGLRGQYVVNKNRFLLYDSYFQTPYYLNVMLGYDKPY